MKMMGRSLPAFGAVYAGIQTRTGCSADKGFLNGLSHGISTGKCEVKSTSFKGRQAVRIGNEKVALTLMTGGGHIGLVQHAKDVGRDGTATAEDDFGSPLWVPPWSTCDPSIREAVDEEEFGEGLEGKYILSHIMGQNLCLDVFGDHSKGEVKAGQYFHGEAGQVTWNVVGVEKGEDDGVASVTMQAFLRNSQLEVTRKVTLQKGSSTAKVEETTKNLVGFQRALGKAEHVTFGDAFLRDRKTQFTCNGDKGHTWREPVGTKQTMATDVAFDYPHVPAIGGGTVDWRQYPREDVSEDLCTLRIAPGDKHGWMVAENTRTGTAMVYAWEAEDFPWLVTWEECNARADKPWNSRTLTRGLEFSSYAYPTGREDMVALGRMLDTPTFEWLDAFEEKKVAYYISLQKVPKRSLEAAAQEPLVLKPNAGRLDCQAGGFSVDVSS